jgi:hypothetical protein
MGKSGSKKRSTAKLMSDWTIMVLHYAQGCRILLITEKSGDLVTDMESDFLRPRMK